MEFVHVLARVTVNPDGSALPGTPQLQSLVNCRIVGNGRWSLPGRRSVG